MSRRHIPLVLFVMAFGSLARAQAVPTYVPAGNSSGGTWTMSGSPYILTGDVTLLSAATLTIEEGVQVLFMAGDTLGSGDDPGATELRIDGTLVTQGAQFNPVVLTSGEASPAAGDYYGLVILANGDATLVETDLSYGDRCLYVKGSANTDVTGGTFTGCNTAIYVEGGSPVISGSELAGSSSYGLYATSSATVTASGLSVHDNGSYGVSVSRADLTLTHSLVIDNPSYGVYLYNANGETHSVSLLGNTIFGNGSRGVHVHSSSGTLSATVRDNVIASNGSYGVTSSGASVTATYNVVWGNATANFSGVTAGTGTYIENPLFADQAARDLRITSRSPARLHASDGGDIGALQYDGTATPFLAGHVYTDETLTAAGSPYDVLGDLTVEAGATLTIEPGATLRFSDTDIMDGSVLGMTELLVQGTLLADGAPSSTITMESGGTGSPGDWYGVRLLAGSGASFLDNVVIRHAHYGIHSEADVSTTVQASTIELCSSYGVYVTDGDASFAGLTVRDSGSDGVRVSNAPAAIIDSQIYDNASYGVYVYNSNSEYNDVVVSGNTIVGNGSSGVHAYRASGVLNVYLTKNIVVTNGAYGVSSSGAWIMDGSNLVWGHATANYSGVTMASSSLSENPLFVDEAGRDLRITDRSPARLHASDGGDIGALDFDGVLTPFWAGHLYTNTTMTQAGSPYDVLGDLTVEPGVTLTIQPGAELRFATTDLMAASATTSTELRVEGTLTADGTMSTGITMQSAGASGSPGDWYGVWLLAGSGPSFLDYVTIRHASYGIHSEADVGTLVQRTVIEDSSSHGLYVADGDATFDELDVSNSGSYGVRITSASPTLRDSILFNNAGDGIYVYNSNAETNSVTIEGNTIVGNGSRGVHAFQASGTLTVDLTNNIVANNGSYGVYNSGCSVTAAYNLVWGHSTAELSGVTAGAGTISENPLFVDEAGGNLNITLCSPARLHASDGGDLGALSYSGDQTIGLQGHLYGNATWTAAASPHLVLGDITVEPGVTLTIEAGAKVQFSPLTDSMGGNDDPGRGELIVRGRLVVAGTAAASVVLESASATPAAADWDMVHLTEDASSSAISHAVIRHAGAGIYSQADSTNSASLSEISDCTTGIHVTDGTALFDGVAVHDNQGRGLDVSNASPRLTNMLVYGNGGHGIHLFNGGTESNTIDIEHSTVADNTTYGVYSYQAYGTLTVRVTSSIIVNHSAYGFYNLGAALTATYNDVWGNGIDYGSVTAGAGSISANPLFVNTSLGNYHLLDTSPAVDAADPASTVTSDADGSTRPIDGNAIGGAEPDMGAYEYNPSANKWPIADGGPDRVVEAGVAAAFDGSGSVDPDGTVVSWAWDFGDGENAAGESVSHTFSGGTDRTVTLTVTDDGGAIDVDTIFVEVNLPPVAEAGAEHFADPGESITFDGASSIDADGSIVLYAWDFGDGSVATGQSVTHQYASPGDYTVTLTVTDDDGSIGSDTSVSHVLGAVDTTPPSISHTPVAGGQPEGVAVTVSATITDATGVGPVTLHYRTQGAGTWGSTPMGSVGGNTYQGAIPAGTVGMPAVDYYIEATDLASPANSGSSPAGGATAPYSFAVVDQSPPAISHTPISDGQPEGQAVAVVATITDASGVVGVTLCYRLQGTGVFTTAPMTSGGGNAYSANIPGASIGLPAVEYYVTATDGASSSNTAADPANAPASVHSFTVADTTAPAITHTPITDDQPESQAITVSADVIDNDTVSSVTLYYRTTGGGSYTPAAMSGAGSTYGAEIPAGIVITPSVDYYIEASDAAGNTRVEPIGAPDLPHVFTVLGADTTPPAITHVPVADDQVEGRLVTVDATVTDATGVGSVTLYYRVQGATSYSSVAMDAGGGVNYTAGIPAAAVTQPAIEYYIEAVDTASPANTSLEPASGPGSPHAFTVVFSDTTPPAISTAQVADGLPEGQDVTVSASIADASGIGSATLYYRSGAGSFSTVTMSNIGGNDYSADIPGASVLPAGVDYYVEASDGATPANIGTDPTGAPGSFFSFTVQRAFDVTPGDVIISEVMHNPSGTESAAEWLELHNPTGSAIDIDGFTLADEGTDSTTIDNAGPLLIPAGGYLVLGRSADTTLNGGVDVDYVYSGFFLSNAGDEILLWAGATLVDGVVYDTVSFPAVEGYSMTLDPGSLDHAENDDGGNWCVASTQLSGADFGTPGSANDSCATPEDRTPPSIVHTPVGDGQPAGLPVTVVAMITDVSGVGSATLYYRTQGTGTFDAVTMVSADAGSYQAEIPGASVGSPGVEYTIEAIDGSPAANAAAEPATGSHGFAVTTADTSGPNITHVPIESGQPEGVAVTITALVTDPSGVDAATLYYQPPGSSWQSVAMTEVAALSFSAEIPAAAATAGAVRYYIEAVDAAAGANAAALPVGGAAAPFEFTVGGADTDPPQIQHVPIANGRPASATVSVTALITDASGIDEATLRFRQAGTSTFLSLPLETADGEAFTAEIPAAFVVEPGIDYYLEVVDGSAALNAATDPAGAPASVHSFTVIAGGDADGPTIEHTPLSEATADAAITIEATITDVSGVSAASVYYRVPGAAAFSSEDMVAEGDVFTATIPAASVTAAGVEYYISALDDAGHGSTDPEDAPNSTHAVTVTGGGSASQPVQSGGCACDGAAGSGLLAAALGAFLALRRRRRHGRRVDAAR